MYRKKIIKLLLLSAIALFSNTAMSAGNNILSSQVVTYDGTDAKLNVQFLVPMGYISHFPASKGKTLRIKLKQLFPSALTSGRIDEQLIVSKNSINPVDDIRYEQETAQSGELTIEFNREVEFEFKLSRDRLNLNLTLKNIRSAESLRTSPEGVATGLPIYNLNLKSSTSPINPNNQPALAKFGDYDIYVTQETVKRQTVFTLHVGYFYSPSAAKANLARLKPFYPDGWVSKIDPARRNTAETWFYNWKLQQVNRRSAPAKGKPEKIDLLMERARKAMIDKNYKQAIRLFTRILQLGGDEYKKESKELLGLARERNGQYAHAQAEYQEYLKLYPEGEDAERVKQRLLGLITARSKPKEKLTKPGTNGVKPEWEFFGSFSQFYRNQQTATDTTGTLETDSSLFSDFLFSGRKRGLEYNQRFNIVANHRFNFISDTDNSEGRLYTFDYEFSKRDDDFGGRIGRQTHSSDGILGRFDGIILNKRIGTDKKVNFLAGYPVELSSRTGLNTDRQFYGLSFDYESLFRDADFKIYYLNQTNGSLTDRTAVGLQLKYVDDHKSYFSTIDYDIFYSELNQATFIGTWRNPENSSINIVIDHRMSPALTTNNALIGQTSATSIEDLQQTFTDDEIYQLARDRTSTFDTFTLSASTFLSERYQLNGDITVSKIGSTVASGGVDATAGTDVETFYNTTLVINNFFTDSDITIFGIRYLDATQSNITQLNFSSNFRISKTWRVNPRLIIDNRDNDSGSTRTTYKPRLIINYRPSRNIKYELDMGYEDSQTQATAGTTTENNFYIFMGYIYNF
jgi:tetratricopeptide (TPR) repeat protein